MTVKVRTKKEGQFEVHKLAALVPMATQAQQEALTANIKENGQQEPIVLYKGLVVDGRCRMKALKILSDNIMYIALDDELSESDVAIWVKATNTRRQMTKTQLSLVAAKEHLVGGKGTTLSNTAVTWAVSRVSVVYAVWLYNNKPEAAEALFDGESLNIIVNGKPRSTSSVTAIYKYYKKQSEVELTEESGEYDGYEFENEAVKEMFFSDHTTGDHPGKLADKVYNVLSTRIRALVDSSSNRGDLTVTQKACIAYKDKARTGESATVVAKKFGVSRTSLVALKVIEEFCHNYVEVLFQGDSIPIFEDRTQRIVTTNKIGRLSDIIKANEEIGTEVCS